MAKSRRLERSTSSFSYSSYHTLEEVGLLGRALASVFPLGPQGLQIQAETSEELWGLWETVTDTWGVQSRHGVKVC